jgi:hypothetical protein
VTMNWTFPGTSINWASAAVSLKPAAAMAIRLESRRTIAWRAGGVFQRPL